MNRLLLSIVCIGLFASVADVRAADEIHWTITGPTSVSFDWRGPDSTLRYGLTTALGDTVTAYRPSPLPFSSAGPFREARISGLLPDTLYHYAIGTGAGHTFRTARRPGASDFTVMIEGDIGSKARYPRVGVVQQMIADDLPAFALMLGDLTYGNAHGQAAVDNHFNDVMVWSQDAAYMPIWGNHEWDSGDDLRNYKGRFDLPNPRTSPGSPSVSCCSEDWYWFDYGNVRFIAYPEPFSGAWLDWSKKAAAVMDSAQANPSITFIVTFGHRPAYSSGHHLGSATLKKYLDQLGQTHSKYKLNLNGNSHNYERSHPQSGVVHITAGMGGSTAEADRDTTGCLWNGGCPKPSWSAFRSYRHGPVRLSFSASAIKIEAICGPAGDNRSNPIDIQCTQGSIFDSAIIGSGIANLAPNGDITSPSDDMTISEGEALPFAGSASDPDGDAPFTYRWTFDGGAGEVAVEDPGSVRFDRAGNYLVEFTVTDRRGLSDPTPGQVTVFVEPPNQAPVAVISSPADNLAIQPGESVNFQGFAADPDGNAPLSYLWDFGGAVPRSTVEDPGPVVFATPGTYRVTFTTIDALGLADPTPATRVISVAGGSNVIPFGVLEMAPSSGIAPLTVNADGRASTDRDGIITEYEFDFGDGTSIQSGPVGTASHTYGAGSWNARLTVHDDRGGNYTVTKPVLVAAPVAQNLVTNASAETDLSGWRAYATSNLDRIEGGFTGGYAMRSIGGPSTASFGINDSPNWVTSVPAAHVGTPYHFSAWVRSPSSRGKAVLQVREYRGSTLVGSPKLSGGIKLRKTWQRLSLDFVPKTAGTTLDLQIVDQPAVPAETLIVDLVAIEANSGAASPAASSEVSGFDDPLPRGAVLSPNPMREGGLLSFVVEQPGPARVQVLDVSGRVVRTLMDRDAEVGPQQVWFDGAGADGRRLASGLYFYRIVIASGTTTRRFAILK